MTPPPASPLLRSLASHDRPRPILRTRHRRSHLNPRLTPRRGFTLVEIMVVVVILGILAATILPQFIGVTHDAKVSSAKAHLAEIESALERYAITMERFPTSEEGLQALVNPPAGDTKKWRGPYVNKLRDDPWGAPYQYRYPGTRRPNGFDLWSMGSDNADGGEGEAADIGNW